jgi:hypothetical protein
MRRAQNTRAREAIMRMTSRTDFFCGFPRRPRLAFRYTDRMRLKRWAKEQIGADGTLAVRTRVATQLLAAALTLAGTFATGVGSYLDDYLFLRPALRLRAAVGLGPRLDPSLEIILFDDASLARLGRPLRYDDILGLAAKLAQSRADTLLVAGIPSLSFVEPTAEYGSLPWIGLGVAVTPQASRRGVTLASVPAAKAARVDLSAPLASGLSLVGPGPGTIARIDGLGALNSADDLRAALGFRVTDDRGIVSLGLLAGRRAEGAEPAPPPVVLRSARVLIDYLDLREVYHQATSFADVLKRSKAPSDAGASTEGRMILLVPEGYTGSRFVNTPFGQMPSFMATLSLASSTRLGRFLQEPREGPWALAVVTLLLSTAIATAVSWRRLARVLAGALVVTLVGCAALIVFDVALPVAMLVYGILPGLGLQVVLIIARAAHQRARLHFEIDAGSAVQRLLVPTDDEYAVGDYRVRFFFKPYGPMFGDWMKVYLPAAPKGDLQGIVAVGDVVGKGISASLATASLATIWSEFTDLWDTSGDAQLPLLLSRLHANLSRTYQGTQNTTVVIAALYRDRARVVAVAMQRWLHLSGGQVQDVRCRPADPLGLSTSYNTTPQDFERFVIDVSLKPGDTLVAATDGILDSATTRRDFKTALGAAGLDALPFPEAFTRIVAAGRAIAAKTSYPDDQTLLAIRRD